MADKLVSKPFNEGAPLDPNELNNLRTDLLNTYNAASTALYNDTVAGQSQSYKFIFNCGRVQVTDVKKGKRVPASIDLGNGFDTAQYHPHVTASIVSNLSDSDVLTVSLTSDTGGFTGWKIWITSNTDKASVWVDWIAVQKVPA